MNWPSRVKSVLPRVGRHGKERFDLRVVSVLLDSVLDRVDWVESCDVRVSKSFSVVDDGLRNEDGEEGFSVEKRKWKKWRKDASFGPAMEVERRLRRDKEEVWDRRGGG